MSSGRADSKSWNESGCTSVATITGGVVEKRFKSSAMLSNSIEREEAILRDLGYLIEQEHKEQGCLKIRYLGISLDRYINLYHPPLDKRISIAVMCISQVIDLHNGVLSPRRIRYFHRDIKLNNFVISEDGTKVYLIDFGNAINSQNGSELKKTNLSNSRPPEYNVGMKWTTEMEIFHLGKMFINEFFKDNRDFFTKYPLLSKMCSLDPKERPDLTTIRDHLLTKPLLKEQINYLPQQIKIGTTLIDIDDKIKISSWSRSFFSTVQLSLREYLHEMREKDSKKAESIMAAIAEQNESKLSSALMRHRHCLSFGKTTGSLIYAKLKPR